MNPRLLPVSELTALTLDAAVVPLALSALSHVDSEIQRVSFLVPPEGPVSDGLTDLAQLVAKAQSCTADSFTPALGGVFFKMANLTKAASLSGDDSMVLPYGVLIFCREALLHSDLTAALEACRAGVAFGLPMTLYAKLFAQTSSALMRGQFPPATAIVEEVARQSAVLTAVLSQFPLS